MIDNYEAVQRLALHEGLRLTPYRCSKGKLTVGVGRNLEDNPLTAAEEKVLGRFDISKGITKSEAYYLLGNDIRRVTRECRQNIPFFEHLDDERQYALVDMAFNLGINGLLKFKKMLAFMGVGNYRQAAAECLNSQYAKEVGPRARRIASTIETGRFKV